MSKMALKPTRDLTPLFGEEPDDACFWQKVTTECMESVLTITPTGKRLLALGDNEARKTLLVSRLLGRPHGACSFTEKCGLEYTYMTVKDINIQTKLEAWILDDDPAFKPLFKYALDGNSFPDTTVLLVASMAKPWDIFNTLKTWTEALEEHIKNLNVPESRLQSRKNEILQRLRESVEPVLGSSGPLAADDTKVLQVNLGVEIIVVIARTECMKDLQSEFGYEEKHFDFLQLKLREFCLSHGAALFYVSVKKDKNCNLLLKYILHRIYSFPFKIPAFSIEPDTIAIPAGWDSEHKLKLFSDCSTIPISTPFNEAFKPFKLSDPKRIEPETVALGDQEFLVELQSAMERQVAEENMSKKRQSRTSKCHAAKPIINSAKENVSPNTNKDEHVSHRMASAQSESHSGELVEEKLVSERKDTALQKFFMELLNKKSSTSPGNRSVKSPGTFPAQTTPKSNNL